MDRNQFDILFELYKNGPQSSDRFAERIRKDPGDVNRTVESLENLGYVENGRLTEKGQTELDRYKVDNAVIMAAGLSSRFAPLSYEKPKGLLNVNGEVLIERQIRQLQEAGIRDIIVVVGYKREEFSYLEGKFHVKLVVNSDYSRRNNNSTLHVVRKFLSNTYLCSSDNYFMENVFASHVFHSYYASEYAEGNTDEYCMQANDSGRIENVTIGGKNSWIMIGHVYFSKEFSRRFVKILEKDYNLPETADMLWEDVYIRHIDELDLEIRKYDSGKILEFDSLDDLRKFDDTYISHSGSVILQNICGALHCGEQDLADFAPLKMGMTNSSFVFTCKGARYVYRHPGIGTEEIINRKSEAFSMSVAQRLSLDDTYITMDAGEGWKISKFIENAADLDYRNETDVRSALRLLRTLHESAVVSDYDFDVCSEVRAMTDAVMNSSEKPIAGFEKLSHTMKRLFSLTEKDGMQKVLCHNDCFNRNFLKGNGRLYLIDWEYSGNADPAGDLGTFICCADYTFDEAMEVLRLYFDRPLTEAELRHYTAYIAISAYYWYVWALYKENMGESVGEYLSIWRRYADDYSKAALAAYQRCAVRS